MKNYFGGEYLKNNHAKRPLELKKSTHLVLRLKSHLPSLLSPRDTDLRNLVEKIAKKYNIKFYSLVFNYTHIHSVILIPNRKSYVSFIREVTSAIVSSISKSIKIKLKNIFQNRPFTRIIQWGRSFKIVMNYMLKNEKESGVKQLRRTEDGFNQPNLHFEYTLPYTSPILNI